MSVPGYEWLDDLGTLPKLLQEALKLHGTVETPGKKSNPIIMAWATELGIPALGYKYSDDSVPWCGLFAAIVSKRAGKEVVKGPLYALNWSTFGTAQAAPELGDLLTFKRDGGGHVGFYVAEDADAYHVLGGNQSDKVCVTRIAKSRLFKARRPAFKTALPPSVKRYHVSAKGKLSTNEA